MSIRARVARRILLLYSSREVHDLASMQQKRSEGAWHRLLFPVKPSDIEYSSIASIPVVKIVSPISTTRTIVYLHGGGFVFGLSPIHLRHMKRLVALCKANVIAIDYSLAPEHPYPQALEEIEHVWQRLIADKIIDPANTALVGDSAGGNLALASSMRWQDAALPQPACLALLSPGLDATLRGKSYAEKARIDPILTRAKLEFFSTAYAGNSSKDTPLISPVYADLKNLPPMIIHVGSEEMLRSDSEAVAENIRKNGGNVSLFIAKGMWHCWHLLASYIPEAKVAMTKVTTSICAYLPTDHS